ncbi:alpha-1,3-mannosyltransferase ALG2 [Hysterangium stoloniferum]|nr:alpha-1,3-mannosyltransferase ALG2 [Hysterangium stoloniferum]
MRIAILHPDLGIGGAERLIVDAALGLQRLGHEVHIFTSHHNPDHCFPETKKGGILTVRYIRPPFPRAILGKGHIVFAHLRQLHLTAYLLLSGKASDYDVYLVDQLSTCIPFLRRIAHKRVVFYGHFPDKLLAGGQFVEGESGRYKRLSIKAIYRMPMDWLEELTTRETDILLANSEFTARVFRNNFKTIRHDPRVVYPGINIEAYTNTRAAANADLGSIFSDRPSLVSLNRFEKKKNAALAIEAFAIVRRQLLSKRGNLSGLDKLRLILAGGFDPRLNDNVETVAHLTSLCELHSLSCVVRSAEMGLSGCNGGPGPGPGPDPDPDVILLLNFTEEQRTWLLTSPKTLALLYTPTNEHFGIIPVEGMISGLPVLACNSGGPMESIVDPDVSGQPASMRTGWLRAPDAETWSEAIMGIISLSQEERRQLSERAMRRASDVFGINKMAECMENALKEAVDMGPYLPQAQTD